MMTADALKPVMDRYEFDTWSASDDSAEAAAVGDLTLPRAFSEGDETFRVRQIETGDDTRLLRMSWAPSRDSDGLIVVDARICPSVATARLALLELLANLQAPDVQRLTGEAPGDIAFSRDASTAVYFARDNVAISVTNGGATIVPVGEIAAALDRWVTEQSQAPR